MNEEYVYVKTDDIQKDMHDFVNQFGDEISSITYVGNTIKLKNEVIYRFVYTTIGIRKYYTYAEIYNHHLKFQNKKLKQENQQLKGSLQTHEILLRANVEENKQLKEQLQQKEDIINKAKAFINDYKEQWVKDDDVQKDMNELLKILDNKGE